MVEKASLCSFHDLSPSPYARVSRNRNSYQDNICVYFCIDMLSRSDLMMVRIEHEDDLDLVWSDGGNEVIEFVQVKASDRDSRWSVASLLEREKNETDKTDNKGSKKQPVTNVATDGGYPINSSILEKSLYHARCKEENLFRIVTSFPVNNELKPLEYYRSSAERKLHHGYYLSLANLIEKKFEDKYKMKIKPSEDNQTVNDWVCKCFWDKQPDTLESLKDKNIRLLEAVLRSKGYYFDLDTRDDIYQSLVTLVYNASLIPVQKEPGKNIITKTWLEKWLEDRINRPFQEKNPCDQLYEKMHRAHLDDTISTAQLLRNGYVRDYREYSEDFIRPKPINKIERMIAAELNDEKTLIDMGEIQNGIESHGNCIKRLREIAKKPICVDNGITFDYLQGYMYYLTGRCPHRFDEAQP